MSPLFTVIVTTHLRGPLLARALASLRAQTFQDFEVIVVADALDAGTAQACAEWLRPQDQFLKRSGKPGPAESRNVGLRLAKGEWILYLDDDDTHEPFCLANFAAAIQAHGQAHPVLFTDLEVVHERRSPSGVEFLRKETVPLGHVPLAQAYLKNFIPNNVLAFRRSVLEGIEVDTHLASLEDWDFLLAVMARATPAHFAGGGPIVHKDENAATHRGGSEAATNDTVVLDYLHIYRRWPAPHDVIREHRHGLLKSVGLDLPKHWF